MKPAFLFTLLVVTLSSTQAVDMTTEELEDMTIKEMQQIKIETLQEMTSDGLKNLFWGKFFSSGILIQN